MFNKNNTSISKQVINLNISYILTLWLRILNTDATLNKSLLGSVRLTKNDDPDKKKSSCYGIGFDSHLEHLFTDVNMRRIVIIFGADMSSSLHVDNKNKDVLNLGEGTTKGLDDTILTAEAKHSVNFTQQNNRFLWSV